MIGTTTRAFDARDRPDGPNGNNRCACGRPAEGYDARREEPACATCARLRADGGVAGADALDYLDAAGDQLETAATKADDDWLRSAIESLRVDLAKLQGFRTAAELRDDPADAVDRGDGIETDGGVRVVDVPTDVVGDFATDPYTDGFIFVARSEGEELFSLGCVEDRSGEEECELIAAYIDALAHRSDLDRETVIRLVVAKLNEIPKNSDPDLEELEE